MKLSAKLRVSYVGIILVAVSMVLFLIIENSERDLKEKISNDFECIAGIEAENVGAYLNGKLARIRTMAQDPVFVSGDMEAIKRYLKRLSTDDVSFADISLVSGAGKVVISTNNAFFGKTWPGDGTVLSGGLETDPGEVFFAFREDAPSSLLLDVAAPLPGRDDKTGASALVASVDIQSILKEEPLSELAGKPAYRIDNHSTMVITRDGKSQIFTPLVYLQRSSPLIGVVSPLGKGHLVFKDPSRGPVIVGFAYLEESSDKSTWAVISMAPQKEAFYPAIRLRNRIIGLGLVAIGVAWFISIFLARGITRPIRRLVLVTDLIAGGNLAQRADIRQDDEVGDLARSFNKMTDKLNMAIVSRDQEIIERKNAEEKLREEMEAKAKFIQLISNEVQTPLTVIREGLGVMEADSQDTLSPRQKNMLRIVRKSGETLAHLVRDIVEFHGIESETTAMNISINDINSVIEDVKTSMVPLLAEKRDVNLIYLPGKDLPKASFDRDKISLVLTNLLNLSIMTTSAGSVELISERKGQNAVLVRVKDERSTIPHDQLSSLFDKFDILGKEKDKKAGGSGLGLTISREIIRKHNGKIWAEPYGEKGVIFNFVLPVSEGRDQQSL